MRAVLMVLGLVAVVSAVSYIDIIKEEWQSFKLEHKKQYSDATEERFRMKIFFENKEKIAKHNRRYSTGEVSFKMGLNKYSDMLHYEFTQTMNGYNYTLKKLSRSKQIESGITFIGPANVVVPNTVDWRTAGAVTDVKNQGPCGSCWAFATTGALEGQNFRKTGVLVSLSEQNLIDCSKDYNTQGCNGGWMDSAFSYIKDNGGIDTEESYPYKGIDDSCHFDINGIGATDTGFVDIPKGQENKLMEAVATIGPVAVTIDASHESFQFYSEGVYNEPMCDSQKLTHAVLAVGYGSDGDGLDYWLVKNSWGTSWGDKGYIKMARNKENQCGIASASSYPLV